MKIFDFYLQEWRQIMPRVEVQPQSSRGSQLIPVETVVAINDDEPMRKRRRQGRKRRRRPQLMMQEDWYGNEEHPGQYFPDRGMERFRPSDPLHGDWEHKPNSYQSIAMNSPTHKTIREREKPESGNWERPRQPIVLRQQDSVPVMFEPTPEVKNGEFMPEVDPPHPLYKVESQEILQSGYEQPNANERKKQNDHKSYRKPYSLKKQEEQRLAASAELNPASQLKSILKQSGGLSLSEVLQQKNLSLSDLLKGKQMALAALVQNPNSKVAGETANEDKPTSKQLTATIATTTMNVEDEDAETETESSSQREQKEYRIRNYIRPKKKPVRVVESSPDDDDVRPTRRVPFPTRQKVQVETTNNNLDEESDAYKDDETRIFPSVETKQMALNPVVPVHRERLERRPIKNVVPKIRPDFSNSKVIKAEEGFDSSKRRKFNPTSTTSTPTTTRERDRERWAPNSNNRERLPSRIPYRATSKQPDTNDSEENVPVTYTTRTPQRERATVASSSTTPKNIDIIRNRLSVKPRIRLPSRAGTRIRISTTSTSAPSTFPFTTEVPASDTTKSLNEHEEPTTTKLEESDVNIIEKFTSFEDTKPKDVESIEQLFPSRERMPASRIQKIQQKSRFSTSTTPSSSSSSTKTTTELPTTSREAEVIEITERHPDLDLIEPDIEAEKNEIIQLLEDRRNGYKLNKVLEQRNMTIDELMEHRQRGSSHVHLQELLKTKRKLAEKAKMEDRVDIVTAFENFPRFNIGNLKSIQPDDIKTDSQGFSYFTSIINIRPTDEIYKEARALQDIHKITNASNRQFKTLTFEGETAEGKSVPHKVEVVKSSNIPDTVVLEEIEQELKRTNDLESELVRQNVMIETAQISGGVKSAIIVSSCIVVIAIILFLVVFALYRWRQRRKSKLNYTESYKMAKGRLPIIHKEPLKDSRLSPMLCAKHRHSSSRLSRMNTMDPNSSVHDYLGWDHMKKPFQ